MYKYSRFLRKLQGFVPLFYHIFLSASQTIEPLEKRTGIPKKMHLDMAAGEQEFTSLDLFFDQRRKVYYFKGKQLALDGAWRSEDEIFGFDAALFKAFSTEVDEDN